MRYLGNINITVWFLYFDVELLKHNFLYISSFIDFHFRFFDHEYLIISIIKNKQTLICYFNAYFSVGFSQNGKTEYNYVYDFIKYFCTIVTYCTIKNNILFCLLNLDKVSEQHMGYSKFFSQHGTILRNQCKFELANGLARRFNSRYWVRAG